jgi:ketosteroid isomerase-like protein
VSRDNVKLWLASIDAYNVGDLDAVMEFYAPDVEVFPALPDARPLHGRAEYKTFLEEANSAWGGARWGETIEVTPLGADRVFYRGEWGGEGLASGIKTAASTSAVVTFQDGLIVQVAFYFDQDQALKAAGLKE